MDPLQELWNLCEEEFGVGGPMMGTPQEVENEHPIVKQRKAIDAFRAKGKSIPDAYAAANGPVDLSDTEGKRDLASTFSRVEGDGKKNTITYEKDQPGSIAKIDDTLDTEISTMPNDVRTRGPKEVDDSLEEETDFDYNWDVAYLQKYGRA